MGGSVGLTIASAVFTHTLLKRLGSQVPSNFYSRVKASIFTIPDMSGLTTDQREAVLDAYMTAIKYVFYIWAGSMGCCLLLMVFVKDKGLQRKEENTQEKTKVQPLKTESPA